MACSRWQLAAPADAAGTAEGVGLLSIDELRALIRRAGLSDAGLIEKGQLHARAREARERLRDPTGAMVRVLPAFSAQEHHLRGDSARGAA